VWTCKGRTRDLTPRFRRAEHLREDRKSHGLGEQDVSDDDDYPPNHFGAGAKKPSRAERLQSYRKEAVHHFKDGQAAHYFRDSPRRSDAVRVRRNGRTSLHFAASAGAVDVMRAIKDMDPSTHAAVDDHGATPLLLAAAVQDHATVNPPPPSVPQPASSRHDRAAPGEQRRCHAH
jgi:hypothetical protein